MTQQGWWKPPLLWILSFVLVFAWGVRGVQYHVETKARYSYAEPAMEEVIDSGTYPLPEGMTIEHVRLEQDPQHPDQLVFRFTIRPLRSNERSSTRAIYIKDGTQ